MSKIISSTLENVCLQEKKSIISGPFGSNISSKFFVDSGIPVIRGNNLSLTYDKFFDVGFVYVTKEKAEELNCYAYADDLIFTAAGTIGQVGLIPKNSKYDEYVISNKQIRARLDTKKIDLLYAYYWFSSPWIKDLLINNNKGSTVPLLTLSEVKNLPIIYPEDISEQRKISTIIESISKKIENNNSINAELEAMAKTIYDYWFLQFDFPNEDGKPYKSSGGKMVWNEELKREIPEGWEVTCVDNMIKPAPSIKSIKSPDYLDKGLYPIVDQAEGLITGYTNDPSFVYENPNGCVVFGDVTTYFKYINFPFAKGTDGTKIMEAKDGRIPSLLLYYLLKDAVLPNIGFARHYMYLRDYKFILPPSSICEHYDYISKEMMKKRAANIKENQELAELRDFLLPLLMNGQLTFKETAK